MLPLPSLAGGNDITAKQLIMDDPAQRVYKSRWNDGIEQDVRQLLGISGIYGVPYLGRTRTDSHCCTVDDDNYP